MADLPPTIEGAPGLVWKKHIHVWTARWQCRTDLRQRGFTPTSVRCWMGKLEDLNDIAIAEIQDTCNRMQSQMLVSSKGGLPEIVVAVPFDGTVRGLIGAYKTDPMSPYVIPKKMRYVSRQNYNWLMGRIDKDMGLMLLSEVKGRTIMEMHGKWSAPAVPDGKKKVSVSHSLVGMLRTLFSFGTALLEDEQCRRLSGILSEMRFENGKRRTSITTDEQVAALCAQAHAEGWHSIALTNSFQWDGIMRQKDVIGEYIPISEPDFLSDIIVGNRKWARGLMWSEIDDDFLMSHMTSKRDKMLVAPLRMAPHVMAEFARIAGVPADDLTRDMLPRTGPVVKHDLHGVPWDDNDFRWRWRQLANTVGIPKTVFNMDNRAGAISDAIIKGASLEHVRHAATHSELSTTIGYDRGSERNTISVMQVRFPTKTGT